MIKFSFPKICAYPKLLILQQELRLFYKAQEFLLVIYIAKINLHKFSMVRMWHCSWSLGLHDEVYQRQNFNGKTHR